MDDAQIMKSFKAPFGPVPAVDPEKVKAAWEWQRQMERDHPGELWAVASGDESKPDASLRAIGYRAMILWIVHHAMPGALAPWTKENQLGDVVFRAIAEVPMEWIDGPREGLPLTLRISCAALNSTFGDFRAAGITWFRSLKFTLNVPLQVLR